MFPLHVHEPTVMSAGGGDGGGVTARDHCSGMCLDIWNMKPLDICNELSGCFAAVLVETEARTEATQHDTEN